MEASSLHCVNPYDINPINGLFQESYSQIDEISSGKVFKLEMEEFGDLAPFLRKNIPNEKPSSIDELNTPIFDKKGPFNFMEYENTCIASPASADLFKFEYDQTDNSVMTSTKDFSVCSNTLSPQQENNNSDVVNMIQDSQGNLLFTSEADHEKFYIIHNGNETPIHLHEDQISASIIKIENINSVVSLDNNNEYHYSNVSSPCDEYYLTTDINNGQAECSVNTQENVKKYLGIDTPENSNSSYEVYATPTTKTVPKLKLKINHTETMALNTPDVIDSVVDLESKFNIIDYVNSKDISTINIEDLQFQRPSIPTALTIETTSSPKTKKRKSKRYDEDDEDYVPPTKKNTVQSSDSESDSETQYVKRGRRPRRTSSVSSDHSDASKYRELRDKNNEASRKSRFKKKVKEMGLEKEADELYQKNIKLKAQVKEYERMVNNFRNNLFKIMLKK